MERNNGSGRDNNMLYLISMHTARLSVHCSFYCIRAEGQQNARGEQARRFDLIHSARA